MGKNGSSIISIGMVPRCSPSTLRGNQWLRSSLPLTLLSLTTIRVLGANRLGLGLDNKGYHCAGWGSSSVTDLPVHEQYKRPE